MPQKLFANVAKTDQGEELFVTLGERLHEVFWVIDAITYQMLYLSPAFAEVWGRPRQLLMDNTWSFLTFVHPDDRIVVERVRGHADFYIEFRVCRPDNTIRWLRARATTLFNDQGERHRQVGIAEDITERKEAEAAARRHEAYQEEMRRRFIEQIIAAQEDERRRIARELHDTMAQSLTSLLVGLRSLADIVSEPAALEAIQGLRQQTASTIEEAQRLARGLRPSVLDDLGFAPAMERLVADAMHAHGFTVDLHISGFDDTRLTPVLETALYRILQEGLTNVARHAEASWVDLLIERHGNTVRAVVEDNGKGFEQDAEHSGLGLRGIQERVALLHGQALIDSSPGAGTTLTVTLPVN